MPDKRAHLQGNPEPDEETPLLHNGNAPRKETPLPIAQVVVLLLLQLSEPITSLSIRPYVAEVRSSVSISCVIADVRLSLLVGSQSLVVTKERSDTTQAL